MVPQPNGELILVQDIKIEKMREFNIISKFDDALKQDAIPQWGASNNANYWEGLTPQIADPNQPGHPFTTRQWDAYWKSEFQLNVIPGSGQIVQ